MLGTVLQKQGWRLEMLDSTHYRYKKNSYEFEVDYDDEEVFVTVPLPGSDSRYRTRLSSTENAEEYLMMHLDNLEKIESKSSQNEYAADAAEFETVSS